VSQTLQQRQPQKVLRRRKMSATSDKIAGVGNKAAGSVKQAVGKTIGDKKMEAEGAGQKARGQVQEKIGDAKSRVKNVVDKF
jgi:uncharacterized protein YjbJ (UPF0337 family)